MRFYFQPNDGDANNRLTSRSPKTLFVWNVRYWLCAICVCAMCNTCARVVCGFLSFFVFHWQKQRVLSGAIQHPEVFRWWPVLASVVYSGIAFIDSITFCCGCYCCCFLYSLQFQLFFSSKKKQSTLSLPLFNFLPFNIYYMYIMHVQLVRCCITRLHAPI